MPSCELTTNALWADHWKLPPGQRAAFGSAVNAPLRIWPRCILILNYVTWIVFGVLSTNPEGARFDRPRS